MRKIALVTYSKLPELTEDDRLLQVYLENKGISTEAAVWDNQEIVWSDFDAIVLRSCWDYHLHPAEFRNWLNSREREGVNLWNSPSVVRWNMDKVYLRELAAEGLAIAPTIWLAQDNTDWVEILGEQIQKWGQVVVKPTISATAFQTWLVSAETWTAYQEKIPEILKRSGLLLQKYIPEIRTGGEWSLIFFAKKYSHAILKLPRPGDFRVQQDFGGQSLLAEPTPLIIAQAQKILDTVAEPLLYSRVDGIEVAGSFMLMELELIEPSLSLEKAPEAAVRFGEALIATL